MSSKAFERLRELASNNRDADPDAPGGRDAPDFKSALVERFAFMPRNAGGIAVPEGWRILTIEFAHRCSKVVPKGEWGTVFRIGSLRATDGELTVTATVESRALRGLLRKFKQRSRTTCECCGAPGIGVELSGRSSTRCPRCVCTDLLRDSLGSVTMWSEDIVNPCSGRIDPARIPGVLQSDFRRWCAERGKASRDLPPYPWEIDAWIAGLIRASRSRMLQGK